MCLMRAAHSCLTYLCWLVATRCAAAPPRRPYYSGIFAACAAGVRVFLNDDNPAAVPARFFTIAVVPTTATTARKASMRMKKRQHSGKWWAHKRKHRSSPCVIANPIVTWCGVRYCAGDLRSKAPVVCAPTFWNGELILTECCAISTSIHCGIHCSTWRVLLVDAHRLVALQRSRCAGQQQRNHRPPKRVHTLHCV